MQYFIKRITYLLVYFNIIIVCLMQILKQIHKQTGYDFIYNHEVLKNVRDIPCM